MYASGMTRTCPQGMTVRGVRIFTSLAQKGVQPPNRGAETTDHDESFHMICKQLTVLAMVALTLAAAWCGMP